MKINVGKRCPTEAKVKKGSVHFGFLDLLIMAHVYVTKDQKLRVNPCLKSREQKGTAKK